MMAIARLQLLPGWQPFLASLQPKSALSHEHCRITDFFQPSETVAAETTHSCRRIAYKINDDHSGIDVRIQAPWDEHIVFFMTVLTCFGERPRLLWRDDATHDVS